MQSKWGAGMGKHSRMKVQDAMLMSAHHTGNITMTAKQRSRQPGDRWASTVIQY